MVAAISLYILVLLPDRSFVDRQFAGTGHETYGS
jgi:hypothetical protein